MMVAVYFCLVHKLVVVFTFLSRKYIIVITDTGRVEGIASQPESLKCVLSGLWQKIFCCPCSKKVSVKREIEAP